MTNRWRDKRVGVLMGGLSAEREVSLETGEGVHAALVERGYDAAALDWTEGTNLTELLSGIDVVWNALHGTYGEDGAVQGLCACLRIPYTGSDVLASAIAMDKVASKRIFGATGVRTPEWTLVPGDAPADAVWDPPIVIKPAREGSSVGVTVVTDRGQIPAALDLARGCHGDTIVERFIAGTELHTGILEGEVLGSVEVVPATEFYDYQAKYQRDDTQYLIPARVDADVLAAAEDLALAAHGALECGSYSRVDLRVSRDGTPFVLEVNTLPGMTSHSLLPKIATHRGILYATLCERILDAAR